MPHGWGSKRRRPGFDTTLEDYIIKNDDKSDMSNLVRACTAMCV